MDGHHASRLPSLDHGRPLSIIHKATINDFLVQSIPTGRTAELSVQDLLISRADAVADSYADVPPDATIEQRTEATAAKPGWLNDDLMRRAPL